MNRTVGVFGVNIIWLNGSMCRESFDVIHMIYPPFSGNEFKCRRPNGTIMSPECIQQRAVGPPQTQPSDISTKSSATLGFIDPHPQMQLFFSLRSPPGAQHAG